MLASSVIRGNLLFHVHRKDMHIYQFLLIAIVAILRVSGFRAVSFEF